MSETQELTFAKRLKEQTTVTHDSVDNLVMSVQPFSSKENYIKFLKLQSVFHKAVDHIYKDAELNKAIPELEYMARYDAVTQDLKDLGEEPYKFDKELPHEIGNKAISAGCIAPKVLILARHSCSNTLKNSNTPANLAHATWLLIRTAAANTGAFVEHLNALNLTPEAEAEYSRRAKLLNSHKVILAETFGLPEGAEAPGWVQGRRTDHKNN